MHETLVRLISIDSMYGCIFSRGGWDTETLDDSELLRMFFWNYGKKIKWQSSYINITIHFNLKQILENHVSHWITTWAADTEIADCPDKQADSRK